MRIDMAVLPSFSVPKQLQLLFPTLLIALAYAITGWFSMLLALPPMHVPAFFPATGIAVAAAFILGRRAFLGIFLGAIAFSLGASLEAQKLSLTQILLTMPVVALVITLQAGVAGWWLRRKLGYPCGFDRARDIYIFLLSTPIYCLISVCVSLGGLYASGIFSRAQFEPFWLLWWFAEVMGVLVTLPIVMALAGEPRKLWDRRRAVVVAVPMLIATLLFIGAFLQARRWEELESLNYLRTQIGWQSWSVLALGLFGTGLLGAFLMLSSGHAARVQAEVERVVQALRESEERWQFALEGAGDGVWDFDLQTNQIFLSARTMGMLGYEAKACRMSSAAWRPFVHPDDYARGEALLADIVARGDETFVFEFRALARNGQWHWLRRRGKLIGQLPSGTAARMIGTDTDIDAEKQRERANRLHGTVMEMLAKGTTLAAILEAIVAALHQANTDLLYVIFTVDQNRFAMATEGNFSARLRAMRIPLDRNLQSGGSAMLEGELIQRPLASSRFERHLQELAEAADYVLCWTEFIETKPGEILGALVAFRSGRARETLPDIDHIQYAAVLADTAIRRRLADEQLKLIASVFEASSEGIIVFDAEHRIVAVNPAFTRLTGYAPEEALGQPGDVFLHDELDGGILRAQVMAALRANGYWRGEISGFHKNGTSFPVEMAMDTIRDEAGDVTRRVCVFSDITDKKIAQEKIQFLATHDALTGLPNRVLFRDRLQQALALAERERGQCALLFIDLDRFKPVNDKLGHAIGDLLLKAVAVRMLASVRESDTVARIGGDEFVVLLPTIKAPADSFAVADKILRTVNEPFEIDDNRIHISASIGVAIYPQDGLDENALSQHADTAMYRAKEQGRNAIEK